MKLIKYISRVIISLIVISIGVNIFVMLIGQGSKISNNSTKYSAIVILGCSVYNNTPSDMLQDRLDKAIELYEAGYSDIILMSGDGGDLYYDEVKTMKNYAVEHGIPENAIIEDPDGFSTYASIYSLKHNYDFENLLIVTQPYHLYRSLFIGRMMGMNVNGVGSEGNDYPDQMEREIREFFARVKDTINVFFQTKPDYERREDSVFMGEYISNILSRLT